jgi:hypothetical protein
VSLIDIRVVSSSVGSASSLAQLGVQARYKPESDTNRADSLGSVQSAASSHPSHRAMT